MTTYYLANGLLQWNQVYVYDPGEYVNPAHPGFAGWNAAGLISTTTTPPPAPPSGSSGLRFALYSELLAGFVAALSGGSGTSWAASTAVTAGTVWLLPDGYVGVRNGGTPAATRSSFDATELTYWTELGNVTGSPELASATTATGITLSSLSTTATDTGLTISPVVPANGIYLVADLPVVQCTAAAIVVFILWDVTAGVQVSQLAINFPASTFDSGYTSVPLSPGAGARTYKLQAKLLSGTADVLIYGQNNAITPTLRAQRR